MERTSVFAEICSGRGLAAAVGRHVVPDVDCVGDRRIGVDSAPRFRRRKVITAGRPDGRRRRVALGPVGSVGRSVDPGFVLPDRTRRMVDVDRRRRPGHLKLKNK